MVTRSRDFFPFIVVGTENTWKYFASLRRETRRMSCWTNKKFLFLLIFVCHFSCEKLLRGAQALHDDGKWCFRLRAEHGTFWNVFWINENWQRIPTPTEEQNVHSLIMFFVSPPLLPLNSLPPFMLSDGALSSMKLKILFWDNEAENCIRRRKILGNISNTILLL